MVVGLVSGLLLLICAEKVCSECLCDGAKIRCFNRFDTDDILFLTCRNSASVLIVRDAISWEFCERGFFLKLPNLKNLVLSPRASLCTCLDCIPMHINSHGCQVPVCKDVNTKRKHSPLSHAQSEGYNYLGELLN